MKKEVLVSLIMAFWGVMAVHAQSPVIGLQLVEEDEDAAPVATQPEHTATPAPASVQNTSTGFDLVDEESETLQLFDPEPTPAPEPEPVMMQEPEPEPVVAPEPIKEPEPVAAPEPVFIPEPVVEPEPIKEPEPEPEPVDMPRKEVVFGVSKTLLEFPQAGGESQVEVVSDEAWKVADAPAWISTYRDGDILTIHAAKNDHLSDREGDVVLSNEHLVEIRVVVTQARSNDYLTLSAQMIDDTDGDGGWYTITVNSNKAWKVSAVPEWCKTERDGDDLLVKLAINKTGMIRETTIDVTVPGSSLEKKQIIIKQASIHDFLVLNPNIITSSGKASLATVKIETDLPNYRVEGLPYWCKVSHQTATSFVIEIADNAGGDAREAECKVTAGNRSESLVIKQEDRLNYVMVSPKIVTASRRGGTITVKVTSSGPWRVVNLPDWCQVTEEGAATFKLNINENLTGAPRSASFYVSTGVVRESMEIKQE